MVDRDFDAKVARTAKRPIPSGQISVKQAVAYLAALSLIGLAILLTMKPLAIALGVGSLGLVAAYPFMKRITWWPQAWLGLTFNWGALVGFAAVTQHLAWPAILLYTGCLCWTLGYDTIYAHQDRDDDALIGVKSTARLFGEHSRGWIAGFYILAIALIASAMFAAGLRPWSALLLLPAAAHLFWQSRSLDIDSPEKCLGLFRANRNTGFMIAGALVGASWLGS